MKTDLQKFVALFRGFGIGLEVRKMEDGNQMIQMGASPHDDYCTNSGKFGGYMGFYTVVYFDAAGKFKEQDFYE